jgi:hypothetical protein
MSEDILQVSLPKIFLHQIKSKIMTSDKIKTTRQSGVVPLTQSYTHIKDVKCYSKNLLK